MKSAGSAARMVVFSHFTSTRLSIKLIEMLKDIQLQAIGGAYYGYGLLHFECRLRTP